MKSITKENKLVYRCILGLFIVLWCILIFSMSAEVADISADRSRGLVKQIVRSILSIFGVDENNTSLLDAIEVVVRKLAHIFLFFVLSILSSGFVYTFELGLLKRFLYNTSFCVFYACTDEFHQLFVEGRAGSIKDVLIDSIGIILGFILVVFVFYIFKKNQKT